MPPRVTPLYVFQEMLAEMTDKLYELTGQDVIISVTVTKRFWISIGCVEKLSVPSGMVNIMWQGDD